MVLRRRQALPDVEPVPRSTSFLMVGCSVNSTVHTAMASLTNHSQDIRAMRYDPLSRSDIFPEARALLLSSWRREQQRPVRDGDFNYLNGRMSD
jgi:hypothetical protein